MARFPEGYFSVVKCSRCGEPYDPANGHICGRGPDPFNLRRPEETETPQTEHEGTPNG